MELKGTEGFIGKAYRSQLTPLTYIHVGKAYRSQLTPLTYIHVGK